MSVSVEGQNCPVCHAYLFDDDDIVFCPVCGAPHHRDCYNAVGHCALEELHGTDRQYDASEYRAAVDIEEEEHPHDEQCDDRRDEEEKVCRFCGKPLDPDAKFCPYCRAPRGIGVTMADPLGGINKDSSIEGVKAEDIARFTVINTPHYVNKFFSLSKTNRVSWNWAAFLFPCSWAFFRKCYRHGFVIGVLCVIASLFQIPFTVAMSHFTLKTGGYSEIARTVVDNFDSFGYLPIVLMALCMVIRIAVRVYSGVYGDYIYRQTALERIHEINESNDDVRAEYSKRGGVNFMWFLLSHMALTYMPYLIQMFIL